MLPHAGCFKSSQGICPGSRCPTAGPNAACPASVPSAGATWLPGLSASLPSRSPTCRTTRGSLCHPQAESNLFPPNAVSIALDHPVGSSAKVNLSFGNSSSLQESAPFSLLPLPSSLSQFLLFFFLLGTGNCEKARESPGGFSSKRSPAVLRRAQRTALNVTLSPSSAPAGRPSPSGSPGGHRALADSPMAGRATMFSVHSEIKSTTLDPSNLLCG